MTGKQNSFVIPSKREKMDSTNSTYTKQALTNQCLNVSFLVNLYYLLYLQHGTKLWAKSISYKIPLLAINSEQNYYWKLNQNQRGSEFCSAQNKLRNLQKWMFSQFFYDKDFESDQMMLGVKWTYFYVWQIKRFLFFAIFYLRPIPNVLTCWSDNFDFKAPNILEVSKNLVGSQISSSCGRIS